MQSYTVLRGRAGRILFEENISSPYVEVAGSHCKPPYRHNNIRHEATE